MFDLNETTVYKIEGSYIGYQRLNATLSRISTHNEGLTGSLTYTIQSQVGLIYPIMAGGFKVHVNTTYDNTLDENDKVQAILTTNPEANRRQAID